MGAGAGRTHEGLASKQSDSASVPKWQSELSRYRAIYLFIGTGARPRWPRTTTTRPNLLYIYPLPMSSLCARFVHHMARNTCTLAEPQPTPAPMPLPN